MFQDLFNHYLKKSQGYGRMKQRLSSLEKEMAELRRTSQTMERKKETPATAPVQVPVHVPVQVPPNQVIFPPTITINLNKNEKSDPLKAYTKKMTKRATQSRAQKESQAPNPKLKEDISTKIPETRRSQDQVNTPSHPTYIEFLNVETIIIDRYEQSNNFGALGIKSLEGKLNIGANYGDKSELPDDAKAKLEEKLKIAKELKTSKDTKEIKPTPKSNNPKPPWDEFEDFSDWDNFFTNQPCEAENNKKS